MVGGFVGVVVGVVFVAVVGVVVVVVAVLVVGVVVVVLVVVVVGGEPLVRWGSSTSYRFLTGKQIWLAQHTPGPSKARKAYRIH